MKNEALEARLDEIEAEQYRLDDLGLRIIVNGFFLNLTLIPVWVLTHLVIENVMSLGMWRLASGMVKIVDLIGVLTMIQISLRERMLEREEEAISDKLADES